jgi:tetratricopeptide (TPR) repeat protein
VIDLAALPREASAALLAERGLDRLVGKTGVQLLIERSVGNPFFLEQCARYVREHVEAAGPSPLGGDAGNALPLLPERMESVILARVERLSVQVREAAKRAAILGYRFDMRVLSAMLRQESLVEAMEPDAREALWSATAELSEIFSHALVRDAVYESQLGTEQQQLHAAAAAAYEQVYSGSERRSRLYEIADHYERAGIRDRALVCLSEAAEYAMEEYENERAITLLRRRLALADPGDIRAQFELGKALIRVGAWDEAAQMLGAAAARFEAISADDGRDAVDCVVALTSLHIDRGATETAAPLIERGIALAEKHDYHAGIAYLHRNRGLIAYREEKLESALHAYETGLSAARRDRGERVIARLSNDLAIVLTKMGRHEEALEAFRANLDLARRLSEFAGISAALNNIGFVYSNMSRPKDALPYYWEDLELCRTAGDRQGQSVALGNIASIQGMLSRHEEALEHFRAAIAIDVQIGFRPHEAYMHQELGDALLHLDRAEEGCREIQEALRIADEIDFSMVGDAARELQGGCYD